MESNSRKNMDKILITGFSGFVSRHFLEYLNENDIEAEVYGIDLGEPQFDYKVFNSNLKISFRKINLLNIQELRNLFTEFKPDYILHLASFSSVAYSWKNPSESFTNNTNIFLNLIATVNEFNCKCRILSIGSSEEYGNVTKEDLPIKERLTLKPVSPYAVARVSQEMLSKVFVDSYHLDIIMTRSFNHIGIYQDDRFVITSFIKRILAIKRAGATSGTIETGDTSIIRDFVDVRDVVRAYYLLLKNGKSGEVYNVCSGNGIALSEVVRMIADEVGVDVDTVINPEYLRPNDNKAIVGSIYKIRDEIGWNPEIELRTTIRDMINYYGGYVG